MKPASEKTTVLSLALVAVLIVVAASINFVNLMITRSLRRSVEVGVRKCFGASRSDLIVQFIGESVCIVGVAFLCAIALAELAMPAFTAFVGHELAFRWWAQPWLVVAAVLGVAALATLASLHPAAILASLRAATVIRAGRAERADSNPVRRVLVVVQFAILIDLLVATGTIQAQMRYAMAQATGVGERPIVLVRTKCDGVFPQAVRELPGVSAAACSASAPTNFDRRGTSATRAGVPDSIQIDLSAVDFDFFGLYDLKPVAGRVFSRERAADGLVLNESAVRKLGFRSAAEAVGEAIRLWHVKDPQPATIIGVVPDFPVESVREPVGATAFYIDPRDFNLLSIALDTQDLPATLRAIDRSWNQHSSAGRPINRFFVHDYVSDIYSQMRLQRTLFALLAVVAAIIACTGLFSLALLTSQRRAREIGLRKTCGASVQDIVLLLTWQFLKPVLWANVIAWPVAIILLQRWLNGFAYHIELPWLLFFASSFATLAIALTVVAVHARSTACNRTARALRYE